MGSIDIFMGEPYFKQIKTLNGNRCENGRDYERSEQRFKGGVFAKTLNKNLNIEVVVGAGEEKNCPYATNGNKWELFGRSGRGY